MIWPPTRSSGIFVSGQISLDDDGNLVGRADWDAAGQAVPARIERELRAHGARMEDVVRLELLPGRCGRVPRLRPGQNRAVPGPACRGYVRRSGRPVGRRCTIGSRGNRGTTGQRARSSRPDGSVRPIAPIADRGRAHDRARDIRWDQEPDREPAGRAGAHRPGPVLPRSGRARPVQLRPGNPSSRVLPGRRLGRLRAKSHQERRHRRL